MKDCTQTDRWTSLIMVYIACAHGAMPMQAMDSYPHAVKPKAAGVLSGRPENADQQWKVLSKVSGCNGH